MIQLPRWVLTNKQPAFYDSETVTSIEMVAKIYGAMQTLIDEYNKFAENTEKNINDFMSDTTGDVETFKIAIRQEFQDFIDVVELKLKDQDVEIQKAYDYLVTNLEESVGKVVVQEIQKGALNVGLSYNVETEDLSIIASTTEIEPTKVQYYEETESITIM